MGENESHFRIQRIKKKLKTAKMVQKVFDGFQNADLCN